MKFRNAFNDLKINIFQTFKVLQSLTILLSDMILELFDIIQEYISVWTLILYKERFQKLNLN
jgi:hypothetical protein